MMDSLGEVFYWLFDGPWYEVILKITGWLGLLGLGLKFVVNYADEEQISPVLGFFIIVFGIAFWGALIYLVYSFFF